MVKRTKINGLIFLEQTTFYIYESEERLQENHPIFICSERKKFEANKKLAKKRIGQKNKFIVL